MKKYVVFATLTDAAWQNTTILYDDIIEEIRKINEQADGHILVQGSTMLVKSLLPVG